MRKIFGTVGGAAGAAFAVLRRATAQETAATVTVDGGDVSSSTNLTISTDGGTAIADASGGDNNFAFVS